MEFLSTYLFLIPLSVLLLSEVAKVVVERVFKKRWRPLFLHGGMPSSHSAFVTSLLIIVGRTTGLQSIEFAMAVVFAAVVWYDAVAIRAHMNKQAKVLNSLQDYMKLNEHVGHTAKEVMGGIAFGAVITLLGIWMS